MSALLDRLKMIRFCEEKNKRVVNAVGLKLYLRADLEELGNSVYINRKEQVSSLWRSFVRRAKDKKSLFEEGLATDTCPWCQIFSNCNVCTYGKRNGICSSSHSNNRYGRIILRAKKREQSASILTPPTLAKRLSSEWYRRVILKIECDSYTIFWNGIVLWG